MAGTIAFIRNQQADHWRRAFSVRSAYDKLSFFVGLLILAGAYRFINLLIAAAHEIETGNARPAANIALAASLVWLVPAFESRRLAAEAEKFDFLPLGRVNFAFASLANNFLVPSAGLAALISFSTVIPFIFAQTPLLALPGAILFFAGAALAVLVFVRCLHYYVFQLFFLATVLLGFLWSRNSAAIYDYLPAAPLRQLADGESVVVNLSVLITTAAAGFCIALLIALSKLGISNKSNRRLSPRFLTRLRLPIKLGELIKKDFIAAWKLLDCWIAVFVLIFYAVIFIPAEFSFTSFSVALVVAAMINASIAFNFLGFESSDSFERLRLSPVRPVDLLSAKSRIFGIILFSQVIFLLPLIAIRFGVIGIIAAILKTAAAGTLYAAAGVRISTRFPFRLLSFEMSFGGSIPATLAGVAFASLPIFLPDVLFAGSPVLFLVSNFAVLVIAAIAYRLALHNTAATFHNSWDRIAEKLA